MRNKMFDQRVKSKRIPKKRLALLERAKAIATLEHDYKEALKCVQHALKNNPRDTDALILKGNILDLVHNYSESRKCYEKVLRQDKNNVRALIDMGDWWSHRPNSAHALSFYNRALSVLKRKIFYLSRRDEFEEAYTGTILLLRAMGRLEEAREVIKESRLNCPGYKPPLLRKIKIKGKTKGVMEQ
jgi:tetratricopeptide (TPR) repeat protein